MRAAIAILFVFLLINESYSQKCANNWLFGEGAGLNWSTGSPVAISGSAMHQHEGVACISDTSGQLLFYTDGDSVWNRTHQVMSNGTGLMGDFSSTNSALIVPRPGNMNQYYLFTSDDVIVGTDGYRYSIVDITLNGGLGDVTSVKNQLLYAPCTEKLQAVTNSDSSGYWLLTHEKNTNRFVSYEITSAGLSAPVISAVGSVFTTFKGAGCMAFSPNGTRLAMAMTDSDSIEMFDFNTASGMVTNCMALGSVNPTLNPYVYGISFSPNSSKLYVSESKNQRIFQFDLSTSNSAAINASKTLVGTSQTNTIAALQLGPDKKIYVARGQQTYLGVIHNPDLSGAACNFVDNGVYLNGGISTYGLPSFVQPYFNPDQGCSAFNVNITSDKNLMCQSDTASICTPIGFTSYLWNTGQTTSCIKTQLAGNYYVTVTDNTGCTAESNRISITVHSSPPVGISVNGDTLTVFDAITQQWYLNGSAINGASSNTYIANQGGSYTVAVTDSNGCIAVSSPVVITGISKVGEEDVVSVYPNPLTLGGWQLTVGANFVGGEVEVFDANGSVVYKSEIRNSKSEIAPEVAKGVYQLRISSGKSSVTRKLVKL
ncbi:MAG: T9SS type A sorting domain-containing protein [Bacteroidota bacterium]